jgi:MYXO-CTERM domain-containing protein
MALVRAAVAAGRKRQEREFADWQMRGRKGEAPPQVAISLLRFAPTHSAADILNALEEAGWELARRFEDASPAPSRPSPPRWPLVLAAIVLLVNRRRRHAHS